MAFNDGYEVFLAILNLFRLTIIKYYYVCVYLNNIDVYIYGLVEAVGHFPLVSVQVLYKPGC